MRLSLVPALGVFAVVQLPAQDSTPFTVAVRVDVTDTTAAFWRALGGALRARAARGRGEGMRAGGAASNHSAKNRRAVASAGAGSNLPPWPM